MVYPKKSLGQNFLSNPKILDKIIDAAKIIPGETVFEVGPGEGYLTEKLLKAGASVMAVEKDDRLIPMLQKKFGLEIKNGKLKLIHGDILDFDFSGYTLHATRYKLVANIPYYITGALIRKFLSAELQPKSVVLMIQKEVAERIVAKDGKESLLSISVKVYGEPRYIATVKAGNFSPTPKVDSAILAIENISKKIFAEFSEEKLFKVLKAGFAHKRKMLAGNLKNVCPNILEILERLGIEKNARAENLPLSSWLELASAVHQTK